MEAPAGQESPRNAHRVGAARLGAVDSGRRPPNLIQGSCLPAFEGARSSHPCIGATALAEGTRAAIYRCRVGDASGGHGQGKNEPGARNILTEVCKTEVRRG